MFLLTIINFFPNVFCQCFITLTYIVLKMLLEYHFDALNKGMSYGTRFNQYTLQLRCLLISPINDRLWGPELLEKSLKRQIT